MTSSILFFLNQGLEDPSGGGRYFPIARELNKNGFKVTVFALHPDIQSIDQRKFIKDGVRVHYVGQMHVLKRGNEKMYFNKLHLIWIVFLSTLAMTFYSLKEKSNVLYCGKAQPINGIAAIVNKIFKNNILFVDCDDLETESNKFSSFIFKPIIQFFEKLIPNKADWVVAPAQAIKENILNLGVPENKIIFMSNGVNVDQFQSIQQDKVNQLKKKYNLDGKKVVLFFGSFSLASGHALDILLKAYIKVTRELDQTLLLLVGGGEDFKCIQSIVHPNIKDSVIFTGKVKPHEVPAYIRLADISVDPVEQSTASLSRGCPLKIFESMALGVPIITSDIGDRKSLLKNEQCGLLVKAGDPDDLARGILECLNQPAKLQQMSEECLRTVNNYSWEHLTKTVLNKIKS